MKILSAGHKDLKEKFRAFENASGYLVLAGDFKFTPPLEIKMVK